MYFPRLDTLRCYAAFMVVFAHIFRVWTWKDSTTALLPLGQAGVVIFFVLSGFLITRLLLLESVDKPLAQSFKEFYIRRSLRIFPIYYLFLAVTYAANISGVNDYGISPWLYLTNFYIFAHNSWIGSYSHLWTLSVEEQFYLIWPFLILFLRGRVKILFALFISVILISIITRFALLTNGFSPRQTAIFSLSSIDFFGLGALIALGNIYYNQKLKNLGWKCLLIGVPAYYGLYYFFNETIFIALGASAMGLAAAGLIIIELRRDNKQSILHNKFTIHLGKISYGIYLYHNILAARYVDIFGYFGIVVGESIYIRVIASLLLTVSVSEVSFYLIEKPFLRLKDKFRKA